MSKRVASIEHMSAEQLNTRALQLSRCGEHEDALRAFDRALVVEPDATYHYNRGNTLHDLGRHDDAIAAYRAAIAMDPTFAKPLINLADELLRLDRTAEALEAAELGLRVDPNSPDARLHATKAATALGDIERALAHWAVIAAFGFGADAEELRLAIEERRGTLDRLAEARAILRCVAGRPGFSDEMKQELYEHAYALARASDRDDAEAALVKARARLNDRRNAAETVDLLQPALEADVPEAQTVHGYLLFRGQGVTKNLAASRAAHESAAKRGVDDSQFELSIYLAQGIGGRADADAARTWEHKAADRGHQRALFNIAASAGRAGDNATAAAYYEKAANAGSFEAAKRLAAMYAAGVGIEQDVMQFGRWGSVAAALSSDGPLPPEDRLRVLASGDPGFELLAAAYNGDVTLIRQALDKGASASSRDDMGLTALMLAALQGQTEAVKLLLECGADVTAETKLDGTPVRALDLAAKHARIRDLLIEHGATAVKAGTPAAKRKPARNTKPKRPPTRKRR